MPTIEMEAEITGLRRELAEKQSEEASLRSAADKLVADMRASDANPLDKDNFAKVDAAYREADTAKDEVAEIQTRMSRALEIVGHRADETKDSVERREARTLAETYIRSEGYKALRDSGRLEMSSAHISSDPVQVASREDTVAMLRTITNVAGSGGGLIWSDRLGLVVPMPQRKVRLLDVITVGTTDSDTIEWSKETTHTDAAAETAYGSDAPEADYGWTKQITYVKRIPHFAAATRGALMDAGQLQTLMANNLEAGVRRRVEQQVWSGDGNSENLSGLLSESITSTARGSDTKWDAVHKAITRIRVAAVTSDELEPNTIVLNPADFENIVLEKESSGSARYSNDRGGDEPPTIWGLQPVVTTLATSGTVVVGDFTQQWLWVREGVTVAASTEHSDFFRKGLVALVAESRCATACIQPLAFQKITGFAA